MTKIAAIQFTITDDLESNLLKLENYIKKASENGAYHIFTPENSDIMLSYNLSKNYDFTVSYRKITDLLKNLSYKLGVCVHIGSVKMPITNGKCYNQSLTFDNNGEIIVRYNKIHLFDAYVNDGVCYSESEHIQAGNQAVFHNFGDINIGYTICYDLRFGYLYNILSQHNVDIIAVPAAFTVVTGKAHWEILLRSRAIENCCYIVAAAQCGMHYRNRKTYGHSMIVNPWGEIMISADSDSETIIYADVDIKQREKIREQIDIVSHRVQNIEIYNN